MSAVERLSAALQDDFPKPWLRGRVNSEAFDAAVEKMLAADPELAAAFDLGLAWQEAKAALPEGWEGPTLDGADDYGWRAAAAHRNGPLDEWDERYAEATGATPAEALRALAVALALVAGDE